MTVTKKRSSKPTTNRKKPPVKSSKPVATPKEKFDKTAFVFNTPLEQIEEAMQRLFDQEDDPMAFPLTEDEKYWLGIWTIQLPDAKARGMTHVPTSAVENAVLKLYEKTKRKKK